MWLLRSLPTLGVAWCLGACGGSKLEVDAELPPEPEPDAAPRPPTGTLRFSPIDFEGGAPQAITDLAFLPGSNEFLIATKPGLVTHYRLDSDTSTRLGMFVVPGIDETADCGLISLAFDPDFATNHFVYFAGCDSQTHSSITRHVFDPTNYEAIQTTAKLVIRIGNPAATKAWHNVGSIGFDATGSLWALFGDKNVPSTSQDLASADGALVRLVPDRTDAGGATPAPDNPFIGMADRDPMIAAYGLRSPWRGTLDEHGRLWIGDVGDSAFEEVNLSRFAGENFGSGRAEGKCAFDCDGLIDPVTSWDRDNAGRYPQEDPDVVPTTRRSVWVGAAYPRTVTTDRYAGRMFERVLVGDFCGGFIRKLGVDANGVLIADEPVGHLEAASSWTVAPDGFIYTTAYGSCLASPYRPGAMYRVTDD